MIENPARLYCVACMSTFVGERTKDNCPECGMHNFCLLRGGDFGTAIHFDHSGLTHESFTERERKEAD